MARQIGWKLRVARAREQGFGRDRTKKKDHLIIKLRGWGHVFKLKKVRLPNARRQMLLGPEERLDYIRSARAGRRFWYTLSYMLGSGGWHRKFVARIRLFGNGTGKPKKHFPRFVNKRHRNNR